MLKRQAPGKKMAEVGVECRDGGASRWRKTVIAVGRWPSHGGIEWGTPGEGGAGALMAQESVGATAGACWCC